MAIHKPALSAKEARRLADVRLTASQELARDDDAGERAPNADPGPPPAAPLPAAPVTPHKAPISSSIPAVHRVASATPKIQVFVSAYVPAPKASPVFDILTRQYPPQKALQMILRRALADYESMLADGSFQGGDASYRIGPEPAPLVQTSHMMPKPLLTLARAHFDPLGLESSRAFGLKLATAALAAFFARETRKSS